MNVLNELLKAELVSRVGWTLIHLLWQGAAVAIALAVVLRVGARWSAQARYVCACAALLLLALLPVATYCWIGASTRSLLPQPPGVVAPVVQIIHIPPMDVLSAPPTSARESATLRHVLRRVEPLMPPLVLAWAAGVVLLAVYRAGGWIYVWRLRRGGTVVHEPIWRERLDRCARRLGVNRKVTLLNCARIDSPAVVGVLKPAILLPLGCLMNLTPAQLEAILAHELAHIRRHDYLLNLIQGAIETLLFIHPATWWISRRIRIERENCCDDLAMRAIGDRACYAEALAAVEALRAAPAPALAAGGGTLLARIRRILRPAPAADRVTWWPAAAAAAAAVAVILTVATGTLIAGDATTRPADEPSRTATITCLDEAGNPVEGTEVYLYAGFSDGSDIVTLTPPPKLTDRDGVVRFEDLPGESKGKGGLDVYARVPGKLAGLASQTPNVLGGRPVEEPFNLVLKPAKTLRGRLIVPTGAKPDALRIGVSRMGNVVARADGSRAAGGSLQPILKPTDAVLWPDVFEHRVNADGTFAVSDVPEDAHVWAFVTGPGVGFAFVRSRRGNDGPEFPSDVTLMPEGVIEGTLESEPPGPVEGYEVVARLNPHAASTIHSTALSAMVGADGRFRIPGLTRGIYTVTLAKPPADRIFMPELVRVEDGRVANVGLRVEQGVVLRGTVLAKIDSKPLNGASVAAILPDVYAVSADVARSARTGDDGRFALRLPEGRFELSVSPPPGFRQARHEVEIDPRGRAPADVEFRLEPAGPDDDALRPVRLQQATVRGRVTDTHDAPISRARVLLRRKHPRTHEFWVHMSLSTGPDGRYEFRGLEPGVEYMVTLPSWTTTPAESAVFEPEPNESVEIPALAVSRQDRTGEIAGTVLDQDGRPVGNAWVLLGDVDSMLTALDGKFHFDVYDREAGLRITVMAEAYQRAVFHDVEPGQRDVQLVLEPKQPGSPN